MNEKKSVSILIPTLNEEENISPLLSSIFLVIDDEDEILIIDGLSSDNTINECKKYGVEILSEKKRGKGNAIKKGVYNANSDYIIIMDADLSMNPNDIPIMKEYLYSGFDIVKGSRNLPSGGSSDFSPIRRLGNTIFVYLSKFLYGHHFTDITYGYIGFKKDVYLSILPKKTNFEFETEFLLKSHINGYSIHEFPSYEKERFIGLSKLNTWLDGLKILKTILFLN